MKLNQLRGIAARAIIISLSTGVASAQTSQHVSPPRSQSAQPTDAQFARDVKKWTTRPEFVSPLVDHLPVSDTIPSPREALGNSIGAPRVLHKQATINGYFRKLQAAAPDRVRIIDIGKSNEGRENIVVMISSAENISKLDSYRDHLAKLADPRNTKPAEAQALIDDTKPIYHITAGLHSAETGPPEMVMELGYRLLTEDSPIIERIRNNIVVAISPVLEADGRDRYVDWYREHLVDETDDQNKPAGPPYWGKYIYHDNNRDINYSDPSAKELMEYYLKWHPPIMHELHESVPFMYTYSGQAPQNPELDPILYGELPFYSNFEMSQMTKYGMPGVWTHGFVDAWSPGYVGFMSSNHNGMLRMYETFGNGGATTMMRHLESDKQGSARGGDWLKREWFRPRPPYKEVMWSMRNNTNYMETGVLTGLRLASHFPEIILQNFYKKSLDAVAKGTAEAPYAYVIPADQKDETRIAFVANILRLQGIEVGRAKKAATFGDKRYPAGSLYIKLNQPYGPLAHTLLKKQDNYPDENYTTYDDAAWTMGMMTHTDIEPVADRKVLDVATDAVDHVTPRGSISGSGATAYAVLDNGSVDMATLRYHLSDVDFKVAETSFKSHGKTIPAGSFIVAGSAYDRLSKEVRSLGLTAVSVSRDPSSSTHDVAIPRVALFSTWGSTQNVGWVRYAFDQYDTPYDLIYKEQVRAGNLHDRYDVIIIPDQGRSVDDIVFGLPKQGKPLPYTKNAQYPSLGEYGSSQDIRGGMGLPGVNELRKFVAAGGTLITLGNASALPPSFGLVDDVNVADVPKDFYAPGPIVKAKVRQPKSPIFYGYTKDTMPVRWATNELLGVPRKARDHVLMTFPGGKDAVLSGFMKGADAVEDRPAIVNMAEGKGRILMFATNPVWRWQNLGEFRMLYNAMLNWKSLGGSTGLAPEKPDKGPTVNHVPVYGQGIDSVTDDE